MNRLISPLNRDLNTFVFADVQAVRRNSGTNMFNALQFKATATKRRQPCRHTGTLWKSHDVKASHGYCSTKTVYKYLPEHLGKSKCRGDGGCQTGEIFIALDLMKTVSSGCVAEIRCPVRNGLMEGCFGPTMLSRVDWTNWTVVVSVVAVDKCRQAAVGSKNK